MNKHIAANASSAVLIGILLATSGCATIVKGGSQGITVRTDPDGASCDLAKKGKSVGVVNPTPGMVQLGKGASDLDVTCRKSGYLDAIGKLSSAFQGWTLGNAILGGVIGIVIDAGSGAMHEYQPEIFMILTPESFASNESRDAYFDDRRAKVLKDSESAKTQIAGKCSKLQCEDLIRKVEEKTQGTLAEIESDRKRAIVSPNKMQSVAVVPAQRFEASSDIPVAVAATPAAIPSSFLKAGDKWKYNFTDRGRSAGSMTVEIVESNDRKARERITREGHSGFAAEREVDVAFKGDHFQNSVALPGGYQLTEIGPYLPPGTMLKIGQRWEQVPGIFFVPPSGKKSLVSQVWVVRQETVRVPAGTFLAWRIETESEEDTAAAQNIRVKIKCTFWYAPELKRTIKMVTDNIVSVHAQSGVEFYELASFEPGR